MSQRQPAAGGRSREWKGERRSNVAAPFLDPEGSPDAWPWTAALSFDRLPSRARQVVIGLVDPGGGD